MGLVVGSAVVAVGVGVGVADVVAFGAELAVLVCVAVAVAVVLDVSAGVAELADDVAVAVVVLGLADVDAVEDADELVEAVAVSVVGDGSVLAVGDFEALAVPVAVLEVLAVGSLVDGDGLGEVLGVAVGVGVDSGNGWHCCTAPGVAAAVSSAAWAAGAASENPEAAAARTPPVTTPTTTGCTCAIRMKGPASVARRFNGTNIRYGVATSSVKCRARAVRLPIGHQRRCPVLVHPYPLSANDHARDSDDLSTSARSGNPVLPVIVTLSDVCHCLIPHVRGIGRAYTRLTRCKLAPKVA